MKSFHTHGPSNERVYQKKKHYLSDRMGAFSIHVHTKMMLQTIARIEKTLYPSPTADTTEKLGKLAVEAGGEIDYILPQAILYIYRDDKVTKIITQTGDYEVRTTLKELESRLVPFSFFRIHKSYLVNLKYVIRLTPWFNGAYHLELEGLHEKLAVSRNYVKDLRQRLEL